jgi:integrase
MPFISGSPSFNSSKAKPSRGKSEKTLRAYNYRLGFFLDFTAQQNLRFLDQIDRKQLLRYVKFLRDHDSDFDDRTVHNIFETLNTFLRTRDILIAGRILAELDYAEKPPKPYTKQELKGLLAAMDDDEKLFFGLFLNSGMRDAEMQNTEYADFNWGERHAARPAETLAKLPPQSDFGALTLSPSRGEGN